MAVITAANLKAEYLFGVPLADASGNTYADSSITNHISRAESEVEDTLHVILTERTITSEKKDYYIEDYQAFLWMQLYEYPVTEVTEVQAVYPTGQQVILFPSQWFKVNLAHGQLQLVPTAGTIAQAFIGQDGNYLPLVYRGLGTLPQLFWVTYKAGFATGTVPGDIVNLVALKATVRVLDAIGHLVLGAGISNMSLSMDGLSQSVGTSKIGSNAYQSRIDKLNEEIKYTTKLLRDRYKGIQMAVC